MDKYQKLAVDMIELANDIFDDSSSTVSDELVAQGLLNRARVLNNSKRDAKLRVNYDIYLDYFLRRKIDFYRKRK